MSNESDGPAFPIVHPDGMGVQYYGMSLRDYMAAKALPVAWKAMEDGYFEADGWESINQGVAVCAYQMADAMIAARNA